MNKPGPKIRRSFCVQAGIWMPPGWYACGWWRGGDVAAGFTHTSPTCPRTDQARRATDGGSGDEGGQDAG